MMMRTHFDELTTFWCNQGLI